MINILNWFHGRYIGRFFDVVIGPDVSFTILFQEEACFDSMVAQEGGEDHHGTIEAIPDSNFFIVLMVREAHG